MPQTIQALLPLLTLVATGPGAGYLAYLAFNWVRRMEPKPVAVPTAFVARWVYLLYWSPRYSRLTVLGFSFLFSDIAAILLAWCSGQDVRAVVDRMTAGLVAFVVSQVAHGLTKPVEAQP